MFNRLKETFNAFIRAVTEKELSEKELNKILRTLEIQLITNDVAVPVAKKITLSMKKKLIGLRVKRLSDPLHIVKNALGEEILKILVPRQNNIDLIELIHDRREQNLENIAKGQDWKPFIVLFLGPNGSGKTTTIAKIAWKLKKEKLQSVLVASDTFRAGAIEQLEKHANAIGVSFIKRPYGSDPASVAYDAIMHAKARKKDAVLIDTAGRLSSNVDLIEEMKKIARVSKPDLKVFVADALSGNDLAIQAEEFSKHVGIDANVLTKVDADVKGGAALTLTYTTKAPIIFVGIGQKYSDLIKFNVKWFIKKILGEKE